MCHTCRGFLNIFACHRDPQIPLYFQRMAWSQNVTSLFRYEAIVRDLVVRVKARNDMTALHLLRCLVVEHPAVAAMMENVSAIIPAPASVWSRWHGRLSIPETLAHSLGKVYGRRVITPPWRLHWRWRKSARQGRQERLQNPAAISDPLPSRPSTYPAHALVIDDVVTTGRTLVAVARQMSLVSPHFFTFATAIPVESNDR